MLLCFCYDDDMEHNENGHTMMYYLLSFIITAEDSKVKVNQIKALNTTL